MSGSANHLFVPAHSLWHPHAGLPSDVADDWAMASLTINTYVQFSMTERGCVDAEGHRRAQPPNSLGPVDPSWLAKLSCHLGIQPAKAVAPLLMAIWPGTSATAICCREACAYLMKSDKVQVPMKLLEHSVQLAFQARGLALNAVLNIREIVIQDPHFIKDQAASDIMVRLDKASMPAPAVASLYLNGNIARMLTPERALYQTAMHLTWPAALTNDDEYLCCQISELLLDDSERQGLDRNLPRHSMHLTEVGGALRQRSETDNRLALIFPKGQVAKARRPRLSEFLGKDDLKPIFRVQESKLRQSEKVVTLRTDVLLRSLGPLAGLLQKALLPVASPPLGPPPPPPEPSMKALPAPSQPVPVKGPMMKPRTSVDPSSAGGLSGGLDTMSPMALSDNLWRLSGGSAPQSSFTRAQSLFLGLEGASEVPDSVRSCWAKFDEGTSDRSVPRDGSAGAIDILPSTSPAAWRSALGGELSGASGAGGTGGMEMGPLTEDPAEDEDLLIFGAAAECIPEYVGGGAGGGKAATDMSGIFSFASEDTSDHGGTGTGGASGSNAGGMNGGTDHGPQAAWGTLAGSGGPAGSVNGGGHAVSQESALSVLTPTAVAGIGKIDSHRSASNGVNRVSTALAGTTLEDGGTRRSSDAPPSRGAEGESMWGKAGPLATSAWANAPFIAGRSVDSSLVRENGGSHMADITSIAGNVWGPVWGSTGTPDHCVQPSASPPQGGGGNYAAALRGGSSAAGAESAAQVAQLTDDQILAHFNPAQTEVCSVLPPTLVRAALDAARRAAPRLQVYTHGGPMQSVASLQAQPGGPIGPQEITTEFLATVNSAALTRPQIATAVGSLSEAAARELVLAGLPPGTLPASTPALTLAGLKPIVRREVIALVDIHSDSLSLSHFDAGVLSHLQRRPEPLVAAALREIARRPDLPSASNKPAYLTHWLMKLADDPAIPTLAVKCAGKGGSAMRPDMRRLPSSVQSAVEHLVDASPWVDWRHFDAGVMKVLQQLAVDAEAETVSELQQVAITELSSVKNMPAYLNKCFNNRLWKPR